MQIVKYIILFFILVISTLNGKHIEKKYVHRLEELEDTKAALNMLKSKIKFTYEPIPEIFDEISKSTTKNISSIFINAKNKLNNQTASKSWEAAVEETNCNLNEEDKKAIKTLSKLLGQTDVEGQTSQIEITESFLENQIQEAIIERQKNEKLYTRLGTIMGMTVVIILA